MFENKIKNLGQSLAEGLFEKAEIIEKLVERHPEAKAGLVIRAMVLRDVADVIIFITKK